MSVAISPETAVNREVIISADSHVMEPPDLWSKALSSRFGDQAPSFPPHKVGEGFQHHPGGQKPHERVKEMAQDGVSAEVLYPTLGLRLFGDAEGKMNLALPDVGGAVLVVSQFTLYGDASKGRRPSFIDAAPPEVAIPLYERFVALLRERGVRTGTRVETGEFGAMMEVELVNDGPVTLILDK